MSQRDATNGYIATMCVCVSIFRTTRKYKRLHFLQIVISRHYFQFLYNWKFDFWIVSLIVAVLQQGIFVQWTVYRRSVKPFSQANWNGKNFKNCSNFYFRFSSDPVEKGGWLRLRPSFLSYGAEPFQLLLFTDLEWTWQLNPSFAPTGCCTHRQCMKIYQVYWINSTWIYYSLLNEVDMS